MSKIQGVQKVPLYFTQAIVERQVQLNRESVLFYREILSSVHTLQGLSVASLVTQNTSVR